MADMIAAGMTWLAEQIKEYASVTVLYERGGSRVELQATYGRSASTLGDEFGGSRIVANEDDWLITVADLALETGLTEPLLGDTITAPTGPKAGQYKVLEPGLGQRHFERVAGGTMFRIHTKRTGVPTP